MKKPLKIAVIAGEESGDLLAADLIKAARIALDAPIDLIGVGGRHLSELGLKSLFPLEDIALIGLAQILKKMPTLLKHIHQTVSAIVASKPDCLLIVDAPDFTHRVAAKVRKKLPSLPIIQYVAPSVWAWRPERAQQMRAFIDHLLVILPFEVDVLRELNGPPATYIGHPLLFNESIIQTRHTQKTRVTNTKEPPCLVVLPGSRRSEIQSLMPLFGETVSLLQQRLPNLQVMLPTLPHLYHEVQARAKDWRFMPNIVTDLREKMRSFSRADVALAASGTVSLELSLCQVPMVACYKADWFAKHFILPKVTIWSASLPNIIADSPFIPEYYNEFIRPPLLARQLQRHMIDGAPRQAQLEGFDTILQKMQNPLHSDPQATSGTRAAKILLDLIFDKRRGFAQLSDANRSNHHQ